MPSLDNQKANISYARLMHSEINEIDGSHVDVCAAR